MNRWAIAVGLAGLGFGMVTLAASSVETVPISLPAAPASDASIQSSNTVLAAANTTSVLPNSTTESKGVTPAVSPPPVTVHEATPNPTPAGQPNTSAGANVPLPSELTPEAATHAVLGKDAKVPASLAAPAVTPAAPKTGGAVNPSAAAVTTSGAPSQPAIAPESSTAAVPASSTSSNTPASLPEFNHANNAPAPSPSAGAVSSVDGASEISPVSPLSSVSTQAETMKKNAVSAQELAWHLDQPNPSKGSNAIPLMLTNPDPSKTNISEVIRLTLATHPQILQDFANQLASQEEINVAKGHLLPSLTLDGGIGPENSMNPGTAAAGLGDVTLTRKESQALMQQLLFDGGKVTNQIREASATYDVNSYLVAQAQEILSYDAASAYLAVLKQRQIVEVYSYDAQAHALLLTKIIKRYQAGAGTKSDVELAQGRLAQAQAQVTQSEGDLATANDTYMHVVGIYPTVNMAKPMVPLHLPGSLEQAQTLGMSMSPNIQGALAQIAAAQAAVGVAKSTFYPTVTINLTKHYNDNLAGVPGADQEASAMVRANYNVFNGGSDAAEVSAANYRVTAAIDQTRLTKRDVALAIAQSWDSLIANLDQIRDLTIHEQQSYAVWQAYIKQFQLGQRTLWDMLNAQTEYYSAQVSVVTATYQAMDARYQLLAGIGALVGTITSPNQDVFSKRPLTPKIMPGEAHPSMVPQIGNNIPEPTIHLPNIN